MARTQAGRRSLCWWQCSCATQQGRQPCQWPCCRGSQRLAAMCHVAQAAGNSVTSMPCPHLDHFVAVEQALHKHLCNICHLQGAHGSVQAHSHVGLSMAARWRAAGCTPPCTPPACAAQADGRQYCTSDGSCTLPGLQRMRSVLQATPAPRACEPGARAGRRAG